MYDDHFGIHSIFLMQIKIRNKLLVDSCLKRTWTDRQLQLTVDREENMVFVSLILTFK